MDFDKLKKPLCTTLLIYATLHVIIFLTQKSLLYHPTKADPTAAQSYEIVQVYSEQHALYQKPKNENKPIIAFLHGNAGNVYHRINKLKRFINNGYGILLIEYTGYGFNQGSPQEQLLYQNATNAINWLLQQNENPIVIYGESLGTGVAIEYLSKTRNNRIKALILETPYSSMLDVSQRNYPFIFGKRILLTEKYDSISKIGTVDTPTLYLLAQKDEVVSYKSGEQLFEADNPPKTKHVFSKAHHNTIYNFKPESVIFQFIDTHINKIP